MSEDEKTRLIRGSRSFDKLYKNIKAADGIRGLNQEFSAESLIKDIENIRRGKLLIGALTNTNGLQGVVRELIVKEKAAAQAEADPAQSNEGTPVVPTQEITLDAVNPESDPTLQDDQAPVETIPTPEATDSSPSTPLTQETITQEAEENIEPKGESLQAMMAAQSQGQTAAAGNTPESRAANLAERLKTASESSPESSELRDTIFPISEIKNWAKEDKEVGEITEIMKKSLVDIKSKEESFDNVKGNTGTEDSITDEKEETPTPVDDSVSPDASSFVGHFRGVATGYLGNNLDGVTPVATDSTPAAATEPTEPVATDEGMETTPDSEREQARQEWLDARALSRQLEEDYDKEYAKLGTLTKLKNRARRAFGFNPKLSPALEAINGASKYHRNDYLQKADRMRDFRLAKEGESIKDIEKLARRHRRLLAYHLTAGINQRRIDAQVAVAAGKYENIYSGSEVHLESRKPAPKIKKYTGIMSPFNHISKKQVARMGVMGLGYGVLAGVTGGLGAGTLALGVSLASGTAGIAAGGTTRWGLNRTWVKGATNNLEKVLATAGDDLFEKDFYETEAEIEKAFKSVGRRKDLTGTIAAGAAMATGMATGMSMRAGSAHIGVGETAATTGGETGVTHNQTTLGVEAAGGKPTPHIEIAKTHLVDSNDVPDLDKLMDPHSMVNGHSALATPPPAAEAAAMPKPFAGLSSVINHGGSGVDGAIPDHSAATQPPINNEVAKAMSESLDTPDNTNPEPIRSEPFTPERYEPIEPANQTVVEKSAAAPKGDRLADLPAKNLDRVPQSPADAVIPETSRADHVPVPEAKPEIPGYKVVPGDNTWNVMEGKGPDTHPVGGQSELLKGMSLAERRDSLNTLIQYMEEHPDFTKGVGISSGDPYKIYPGEHLNVSVMDEKMGELLSQDVPVPTPKPPVEALTNAPTPEIGSVEQPDGSVTVFGLGGDEFVEENPVSDVHQMTVNDALNLYRGVEVSDPTALKLVDDMGMDKAAYEEVVRTLLAHDQGQVQSLDLKVGEYLKQNPNSVNAPAPVTPAPQEAPVSNINAAAQEASFIATEADPQAVQQFVADTEKSSGFLFSSQPDVSGSFDRMKDMTVGDMKNMAIDPQLASKLQQLGLTQDGWNRWSERVADLIKQQPANDNETLAQYINRTVNTRAA